MIKIIRRNQKKAAAFFGVFLMISFAFTFGKGGGGGGQGQDDRVVATINSGKVYSSELANAKAEVDVLRSDFSVPGEYGQPQPLPLLDAMAQKPDTFFLLKTEAAQAGVRAGVDQVGRLMLQYQHRDRGNDKEIPESDRLQFARTAAADYLAIRARFEEVASYAKVTKPEVDQKVTESGQKITFNVATLAAAQYLSATTKPTDAAMQKQFEQFKEIAPGDANDTSNPFGFGYRLPVKQGIQYLKYNRDDLEQGVIARTNYNWDVVATSPMEQLGMYMKVVDHYWRVAGQKYYLANPAEFSKAPLADAAPVLQPLTDDVLAEAIKKVRDPMIDALGDQLKNYLSTTTTADWTAYHAWLNGGSKGPEPVTAAGVPFSSPDYFPKLAASISKNPDFRVPVTAGQSAGDVTNEQAANTAPYGSMKLEEFVITTADAYLKQADRKSPAAVAGLVKPSDPLESTSATTQPTGIVAEVKTFTIARLTDVQPSVAPADLAAVAPQVEADLRTAEAYGIAQKAADKLLVDAGRSNLRIATLDTPQMPYNATLALSSDLEKARSNPMAVSYEDRSKDRLATQLDTALKPIEPPLLSTTQKVSFLTQSLSTLGVYDAKKNPHPLTIVKIPAKAVVYVAEVKTVVADWSALGGDKFYTAALSANLQLRQEQSGPIFREWFDPEKIAARLGYKPVK